MFFDRIILYFDGASRHNPHGPAGCGFHVVEMDDDGAEGDAVIQGYYYLGYNWSNNEAEYQGLIEGLTVLRDSSFDFNRIFIRGDSEIVINQMTGEYEVRSDRIIPKHQEAKDLIDELDEYAYCSFRWVPRTKNYIADSLARQAIEDECDHVEHF